MSEIIEWVLEMDIRDGQQDGVQPLIDEMSKSTQADEPGALHYEYYLNADQSRCTVIERYADSAAALVHLETFGAKYADRFFAAFSPVRFTIYGPASAGLREATSALGATFEDRVTGFHR